MKQLTKLMEEMKQGVYRDTLKDIYIDESVIAHQEERCKSDGRVSEIVWGQRSRSIQRTGTK